MDYFSIAHMNEDYIRKESEELEKKFDRLKTSIIEALKKHPHGVTQEALLCEISDKEDHEIVRTMLAFMVLTERSVHAVVGYTLP